MSAELSRDDWKSRVGGLGYRNRAFIGGDITTPFGGYKQSGIGRDKSLHAFDKFTQIKTTWIQLG